MKSAPDQGAFFDSIDFVSIFVLISNALYKPRRFLKPARFKLFATNRHFDDRRNLTTW